MEEKLLATLGRKQIKLEEQDEAYSAILGVLAGVVLGTIDRSRVLVNLTDRTWTVSEEDNRPSVPMQVNGLPKYIIAPDEAVRVPAP